jgi:indole-3-glycerol phosphate synthase
MKKVIKLTESDLTRIVRRVIQEQALGGLLDMPEVGQDVVGINNAQLCKTTKTSSELVMELFMKLKKLKGLTSQSDKTIQSWVQRLSKSMSGVGVSNDLLKVFKEIKTPQQMGSVLIAYNNKFGRSLYKDLSGEHTITWETIWTNVKKFSPSLNISYCKTLNVVSTSAT